jgi:hypothetical protein
MENTAGILKLIGSKRVKMTYSMPFSDFYKRIMDENINCIEFLPFSVNLVLALSIAISID